MKTTVQISDPLLARAKVVAREAGTTLAALVEEGLRRVVDERSKKRRAFKLKRASVGGKGLNEEYANGWTEIRSAIYEGRGG
ncbi:MAG TPA: hypothetical protein VFZ53_01870 [Polyangiaceae bacterium]